MTNVTLFDYYARLRNSVTRTRPTCLVLYSNLVFELTKLFYNLGYIASFKVITTKPSVSKTHILINLNSASVAFKDLKPISKPSRRKYVGYKNLLSRKFSGLELVVLSTSCGVLTKTDCIVKKLGGELLFIFIKH